MRSAGGVDKQVSHLQEVTGEMSDLSAAVEEVVAMADEVASVSEEAAAEADSVSAAAAEQSASPNQVSGEVERLARRAADLRELAGSFETDEGAGDEGGVEARPADGTVDGRGDFEFGDDGAVADGGEPHATDRDADGTESVGDYPNGAERN